MPCPWDECHQTAKKIGVSLIAYREGIIVLRREEIIEVYLILDIYSFEMSEVSNAILGAIAKKIKT